MYPRQTVDDGFGTIRLSLLVFPLFHLHTHVSVVFTSARFHQNIECLLCWLSPSLPPYLVVSRACSHKIFGVGDPLAPTQPPTHFLRTPPPPYIRICSRSHTWFLLSVETPHRHTKAGVISMFFNHIRWIENHNSHRLSGSGGLLDVFAYTRLCYY